MSRLIPFTITVPVNLETERSKEEEKDFCLVAGTKQLGSLQPRRFLEGLKDPRE